MARMLASKGPLEVTLLAPRCSGSRGGPLQTGQGWNKGRRIGSATGSRRKSHSAVSEMLVMARAGPNSSAAPCGRLRKGPSGGASGPTPGAYSNRGQQPSSSCRPVRWATWRPACAGRPPARPRPDRHSRTASAFWISTSGRSAGRRPTAGVLKSGSAESGVLTDQSRAAAVGAGVLQQPLPVFRRQVIARSQSDRRRSLPADARAIRPIC